MRIFNNPDLYPTPENVIAQMTWDLELNGKTVFEPSAGLGDIADFCAGSGATVLACEIVPELAANLSQKHKVIADDFLKVTSDQVSHIDYILMNPPFSADEKHILHAWDVAPEGCTIVALCNWETLSNTRYNSRKELMSIIKDYGHSENLGDVFATAERKTNTEIGLVKLFKPKSQSDNEFEGFFLEEEEEQQYNGLQQYNFVRDVVNRYVGAVKIFDEQLLSAQRMNDLTGSFFSSNIALSMTSDKAAVTREEYKKDLQKSAWKHIFSKFNMEKYSTQKLKDEINVFVEKQTKIPFTMRNIYHMIQIVIGTNSQRMDKALLEVFDKLTAHYHDNRYNVEGWKTNSHYLVNEKFILPNLFGDPYGMGSGLKVGYGNRDAEVFQDFMKALCYITGKDYDKVPRLDEFLRHEYVVFKDGQAVTYENPHNKNWYNVLGFSKDGYDSKGIQEKYTEAEGYEIKHRPMHGEWFDYEFFTVKGFKKGTGHFKFKDRDVWATFNQQIARIKGFPLPEAVKTKRK